MKRVNKSITLILSTAFILGMFTFPVRATGETYANITNTCVDVPSSIINTSTADYTYEEMIDDMEALDAAYANCSIQYVCADGAAYDGSDPDEEPDCHTVVGRQLLALVIGSDTAENRFLLIGSMHAREMINTQLLMKQAEFILYNNSQNKTIQGTSISSILDDCQFYFVPMANPDGTMLSQAGTSSLSGYDLTSEQISSMTDSLNDLKTTMNDTYVNQTTVERDSGTTATDFTYWKSNAQGTDIHYNFYDSMMKTWLDESGYLSRSPEQTEEPMYRDYMGAQPLDTPEATAIADYCNEKKFNIVTSYHSQIGRDFNSKGQNNSNSTDGGRVSWNFGLGNNYPNSSERSARFTSLQTVGNAMATFMQYESYDDYDGAIGFAGWYQHMFPRAYACVVETGMLDYLMLNSDTNNSRIYDPCPLDIRQLTTDVTSVAGTVVLENAPDGVSVPAASRTCIWTRQKLAPLFTAKLFIDNPTTIGTDFPSIYNTSPSRPRFLTISQQGSAGNTAVISYDTSWDNGGSAITGQKLFHSTDGTTFQEYTTNVSYSNNTFTASSLSSGTHYFKVKVTNANGDSEYSTDYVKIRVAPFTDAEVTGIKFYFGDYDSDFNKITLINGTYEPGTINNKCIISKTNYSSWNQYVFKINWTEDPSENAFQFSTSNTGVTFYSNSDCTTVIPQNTSYTLDTSDHKKVLLYAKVTSSTYPDGIYYQIFLSNGISPSGEIKTVCQYGTDYADGYGPFNSSTVASKCFYGQKSTSPTVYQSAKVTANYVTADSFVPMYGTGPVLIYTDPGFNNEITSNMYAYIPGRNLSDSDASGKVYYYTKTTAPNGIIEYGKVLIRRYLATTDPRSTQLSKAVSTTNIVYGAEAGTIDMPITATRSNFANLNNYVYQDNIKGQTGSTVTFYQDSGFSDQRTIAGTSTFSLLSGSLTIWCKVVAADNATTNYYKVVLVHQ